MTPSDDQVPTHLLRSGLEFAVLVAREGPKLKPPLKVPQAMKRYVKADRLTPAELNGVRRALEADQEFRSLLSVGATDDLVDEIGRLWLQRPSGWEREIAAAVDRADREANDTDLARQLKRAEKRRDAAERAAARSAAELVERESRLAALGDENDALRSELEVLAAERSELVDQLAEVKLAARHARDRELAAIERERALRQQADEPSDPVVEQPAPTIEIGAVERAARVASELAANLAALVSPPERDAASGPQPGPTSDSPERADAARGQHRRPLKMPPGVVGSSDEGGRFLLRSGAPVLVDGYNVSKLAWGHLALDAQRDRLVTALEMLSRRFGVEITVVFDGADIVGGHGGRHTGVRVVFSSAGESADDWIRNEASRLLAVRNVVVITNDREIVDGVTALGANHLSSDQLLALLD